ncbi:sensor histidine kinase [Microbacterium sp. RG1]|uniref:sensor histidine kinase n=1 Tax=Microbacterium sp. RG1 TaxID=2489212 RepID=UPI0010CA4C52|nr:HAMP domain-containing sensor histidine kinase [Microbacterium sp. RG1]QCQ17170.1 HAMP domain-containing histidine kinase [Microbacterium sp. RG1]
MIASLRLRTVLTAVAAASVVVAAALIGLLTLVVLRLNAQSGSVQEPSGGGFLYADAVSIDQVISLSFGVILPLSVLIVAAVTAAAWLVIGRLTRPYADAVTTLVEAEAEQERDVRLVPPSAPAETRDLFVAVNTLLDQVQASAESGNRFAANASHELRTPLATSRTLLQVALRDRPSDEAAVTFRRLLSVNDRMISITSALLELAAAEAHLSMSGVDLRELVAEQISELEAEIRERRVKVKLRLDPVRIIGNRQLLGQLLANLLRNAVIHNQDGGTLAVSLTASGTPVLAIENDGEHIPPELLQTLAEPFTRLHARTGAKGHGLGLSIAQRIAELHTVDLSLSSRPSGGLLVTLRFEGSSTQDEL